MGLVFLVTRLLVNGDAIGIINLIGSGGVNDHPLTGDFDLN
jgi:hypothetical protein